MAATGKTPISLYVSTTASNVPTAGNLVDGELAINSNDGILYYKDSSGVVQKIANKNAATLPLAEAYGGNGTSVGGMYGFANRIINGDMRIDQRNSGGAVTPTSSGYLVDRFTTVLSQASKLTFQQVADAPSGFWYSLKVSVASQYNPSSSEQFILRQAIEGFNVIDLSLGQSSAKAITLSNWIKGSVAGTYSVYVENANSDRSYVGTISVTTSWAQVVINLNGDTSGTWFDDNRIGLWWGIDLGCGSALKAPSNNSWQAGDYKSATGSVVFVNQTVGSTLNITGVDLRKGTYTTAPAWDFRDYGRELILCQRYFEKSYDDGTNVGTATSAGRFHLNGCTDSGGNVIANSPFKVTKRVQPTMNFWRVNGTSGVWDYERSGSSSSGLTTPYNLGMGSFGVYTGTGSAYVPCLYYGQWIASAEL